MMGWSRRNKESREKYRRYWSALSNEDRQAWFDHIKSLDRKVNIVCYTIIVVMVVLIVGLKMLS